MKDILVLAIIALAMVFAIKKIIKDKKNGKTSCSGDCSNCMNTCYKK